MITPIIVPMQVAASTVEIPMEVEVAFQFVEGDEYEGPYTVTPSFSEQTLATNQKLMLDNVTVYEIPVTRTSNPQGGLTVIIG